MKASDFDAIFDHGGDVKMALDLASAHRPLLEKRRVCISMPAWMIQSLDREASRIGVTRQSIIKLWLAERLEQLK